MLEACGLPPTGSCSCQLPNSNPNRSTIRTKLELGLKLKPKLETEPRGWSHVGNWHVCSHFDCNFFSFRPTRRWRFRLGSPLERVKFVLAIKSQRQWKTQIKRQKTKFSSRYHFGQQAEKRKCEWSWFFSQRNPQMHSRREFRISSRHVGGCLSLCLHFSAPFRVSDSQSLIRKLDRQSD